MSLKTTTVAMTGLLTLTACQSDSMDGNDTVPTAGSETRQVCQLGEDGELSTSHTIDVSTTAVLIQSATAAAGDIDIDSLPQENQIAAVFALTAFLAPSFADTVSGFTMVYACTDEMYELNQCNWQEGYGSDGEMVVDTIIGAGNSYTSVIKISESASAQLQTSYEIQGTIGDLGNVTVKYYEEGQLSATRVSTLSASGAESVRWTSELTNWFAEESANCSGSLTYEDIQEAQTVSANAEWSFGGSSTAGELTVVFDDDTPETVTLNW
ncbi:hypothetical protein ST37_02275 (plasmid) [Vibrio sp. qd031]|uniref:hypothetical protein n=1 Tax=Vibrio sp. qd031 TaxID=1603038 RepID=UPI000A10906F|nr:hypothetical protein [Vibrio sp. qd031]ORT52607.1 hypothetical protein ST37_02275 [Vibrio sp. qd031]